MPMPSRAKLAGSGTEAALDPAGGTASENADAIENDVSVPLRFKLAIRLALEGSNALRLPAGVNTPRN